MRAGRLLAGLSGVSMVGGALTVLPMMLASTMGAATSGAGYSCSTPTVGPRLPVSAPGELSDIVAGHRVTLDSEQVGFARTIIDTGRSLKVPPRGQIVAIATALQESTLRNLTWGDRDSIGLFQQRNAWGSRAQRLDPAQSAEMFYTGGHQGQRGLLAIPGWQEMAVSRAAQEVQVSAFPDAYAKWETLAALTVQQISGGVVARPEATCVRVTPTPTQGPATGSCATVDVKANYSNGRLPDSALCPLPFAKGHRLRGDAAAAFIKLNAAYRQHFGRNICVTDSYRTYDEQVRLYATKPQLAARPGTSNHGWGLATDLCGGLQDAGSPEDMWMHAHEREYGWEHPGWAEPSGSRPEPWHHGYFAAGDRT